MRFFTIVGFLFSLLCAQAQSEFHIPMYFVVVDTSFQFDDLNTTMHKLAEETGIELDALHRFDRTNNRLCDYDSEYAEANNGDSCFFYVRRFPSPRLSIEYLQGLRNVYANKFEGNASQYALVAGNYQTQQEALQRKKELHAFCSSVFILEAESYMGCTR